MKLNTLDLKQSNHTYTQVPDYCLNNSRKIIKLKNPQLIKKPCWFFFKIFEFGK